MASPWLFSQGRIILTLILFCIFNALNAHPPALHRLLNEEYLWDALRSTLMHSTSQATSTSASRQPFSYFSSSDVEMSNQGGGTHIVQEPEFAPSSEEDGVIMCAVVSVADQDAGENPLHDGSSGS